MSDIVITLSPAGDVLMIAERWRSGGRPQHVEITLRGADLDRLRAVLMPSAPPAAGNETSKLTATGTKAANWPAIAAYLNDGAD